MTTDSIEKTIELKAPIARVWRSLTNHAEFGQWFHVALDGPFLAGQVTTGHMTHPDCGHMKFWATVQKLEPEHFFSYRWHPYAIDPAFDYSKEPTTLVEFRLKATPGGTQLVVRESGFDQIPASRRAEAFPMHEEGWTAQMQNIANYVSQA